MIFSRKIICDVLANLCLLSKPPDVLIASRRPVLYSTLVDIGHKTSLYNTIHERYSSIDNVYDSKVYKSRGVQSGFLYRVETCLNNPCPLNVACHLLPPAPPAAHRYSVCGSEQVRL